MVEGVVTSGERFKARTTDNLPTTDVKNTWNSYYDSIVPGFFGQRIKTKADEKIKRVDKLSNLLIHSP